MQLQGKVRGDVVRRVGFPESALPHEEERILEIRPDGLRLLAPFPATA